MNKSVGTEYQSPVRRFSADKLPDKENSPLEVSRLKNLLQSKTKVVEVTQPKVVKGVETAENDVLVKLKGGAVLKMCRNCHDKNKDCENLHEAEKKPRASRARKAVGGVKGNPSVKATGNKNTKDKTVVAIKGKKSTAKKQTEAKVKRPRNTKISNNNQATPDAPKDNIPDMGENIDAKEPVQKTTDNHKSNNKETDFDASEFADLIKSIYDLEEDLKENSKSTINVDDKKKSTRTKTEVTKNSNDNKDKKQTKKAKAPKSNNDKMKQPNNSIKKPTQRKKSKSIEANQSGGSSATETSGYNSSLDFQSLHRTTVHSTSVEDNVPIQTSINKTLKNDSVQSGKRHNKSVDKSKSVLNVSQNDKEAVRKFLENMPLKSNVNKSVSPKNSSYAQKATGTVKKEIKEECSRQSRHVSFQDTTINNESSIKKASKGIDKEGKKSQRKIKKDKKIVKALGELSKQFSKMQVGSKGCHNSKLEDDDSSSSSAESCCCNNDSSGSSCDCWECMLESTDSCSCSDSSSDDSDSSESDSSDSSSSCSGKMCGKKYRGKIARCRM